MNKSNFIWHMIGSGVYSLASILFVMIARRLVGETAGAAFYMAFTTGQMLLTIGYFEIRPFQVTDVTREYEPKEYFGFRILSSLLMLLCGVGVGLFYMVNGRADSAGFVLILTMCVLKMFDGLADVFEGEFQRNEHLDIAGKSLTFRTIFIILAFTAAAYITKNIYVAAVIGTLAGFLGVIVVAWIWNRDFEMLRLSLNPKKMKALFDSTILLFLGSAMCTWIWNGTKYVVEWNLTARETLIYGIIFMPTMVINLGSGFLFKPMLTTLARHFENRKKKKFIRLMWLLAGWVAVMTAVTLLAAAWLGVPILSILYDVELAAYRVPMLILIVAGGFNAMSIVLYYALTVMRRQVEIFAGYIVSFIISIALPIEMVRKNGLMGAAWSYLIVMVILTGIFLLMVMKYNWKKEIKKEEG